MPGRPWRLHPSKSRFVASPRIGLTSRPNRSGRIEARTGIRYARRLLDPPISRTVGFPQYGWKAGLSGGTGPMRLSAQACSRHALTCAWFVFALRAPRGRYRLPRTEPGRGLVDALPCGGYPTYPRGPRSELCCLDPSSLSRPHAPHSRAQRDFTARRLIRAALPCGSAWATRERFRSFADHSVLACHPLRPRGVRTSISSSAAMSTLAFAELPAARHSQNSRNPFRAGCHFEASTVHPFATACQFACPPARI